MMNKLPTFGPALKDMAKVLGRPANPRPEQEDWMSHISACVLADVIMGFWQARGYRHVVAWAEKATFRERQRPSGNFVELWCVRSNMVNGMPPAHAAAA